MQLCWPKIQQMTSLGASMVMMTGRSLHVMIVSRHITAGQQQPEADRIAGIDHAGINHVVRTACAYFFYLGSLYIRILIIF